MARDRIARDLRGALLGVLAERLSDPERLALAVFAADVHACQLAAEIAPGRPAGRRTERVSA